MRTLILHDSPEAAAELLPLTYTRPISYLRPGILTIKERYERLLPGIDIRVSCSEWLTEKFGTAPAEIAADTVSVDPTVFPDRDWINMLAQLQPGEAVADQDGTIIAVCGPVEAVSATRTYPLPLLTLRRLYDLFGRCGECVTADFELLSADRASQPLSASNTLIGPVDRLFIEPGAVIEGAVLNTLEGPIYIGREAHVMEGACLRGPVGVGDGTQIKMGTKVYGPSTFGPACRVGGEVANVVMFGYSNKAHDGFLGNAVVGEWCNIGAGCSASNLKNDYSEIKLWNYPTHRFQRTGLIHCGPVFADHAKTGVNTMLNTATVLGVGVNIHGTGFPRNFVASFLEGSAAGFNEMPMRKFLDIARRMMERRGVILTPADERLFDAVHRLTQENRG